jgi:hypothetical protein
MFALRFFSYLGNTASPSRADIPLVPIGAPQSANSPLTDTSSRASSSATQSQDPSNATTRSRQVRGVRPHRHRHRRGRRNRRAAKQPWLAVLLLCFYLVCSIASALLVLASFYTAADGGHSLNLLALYPVSTIESLALAVNHCRELYSTRGSGRKALKFLYAASLFLILAFNTTGWTLWRIGQSSHNNKYLQLSHVFFHLIGVQFLFMLGMNMMVHSK